MAPRLATEFNMSRFARLCEVSPFWNTRIYILLEMFERLQWIRLISLNNPLKSYLTNKLGKNMFFFFFIKMVFDALVMQAFEWFWLWMLYYTYFSSECFPSQYECVLRTVIQFKRTMNIIFFSSLFLAVYQNVGIDWEFNTHIGNSYIHIDFSKCRQNTWIILFISVKLFLWTTR